MNKSKVFFTSDTHFGHGNIIKYCHRPFLSEGDKQALGREGSWHDGNWKGDRSSKYRISDEGVDLMNQTMITNINNMVAENDVLYHLGDWAFAHKDRYYQKCKQYRDRIRCQNIHLIWGNHDQYSIRDLFSSAQDLSYVQHEGQTIILCHYAMAVWEKSHRGAWQLYGHSHAGAEKWMDLNMPGRRSVDVGVDNAQVILGSFRPWSFEELRDFMAKKSGFSMDHHVPLNSVAPTEEILAAEHVVSINGREHVIHNEVISYEDIARLAKVIEPTITYHHSRGGKFSGQDIELRVRESGIVNRGQTIALCGGFTFTALNTGNA